MSLQQFCVRWNNHLKIFQSALPRYFQNQKFLDCTLVAEGQHFISCHRMVLDACSDYFATFLKNKMFDDRNLVICLPKEIKLWQIQAILQFMYHGEVCISQEGLPSLVKCAELLQVKGLCGGDRNTSSEIVKNQNNRDDQNGNSGVKNKRSRIDFDETMTAGAGQSQPNNDLDYTIPAIEIDENESETEYNGQIIKKEIDICDVMEDSDDDNGSNYANQNKDYSQTAKDENDDQNQQHRENNNYDINQQYSDGSKNSDVCKLGLIRVKNNLFDNSDNNHTTLNDSGILDFEDMRDDDDDGAGDIIAIKNNDDDDDDYSNNSLIYNRNSMDVYVKRKNQQDGDANQTTSSNLTHIKNSPTSSSSLSNNNNQFENIVCAPNLLQYMSDSENNENDLKIDDSKCVQEAGEVTTYYMPKKLQLTGNADGGNLFDLMRQKFATCDETSFIPVDSKTTLIKKNNNSNNSGDTNESHFVIASVSSLNKVSTVNKKTKTEQENEAKMFQNLQKLCGDEKASIGGLYLRNPRGNQVRQYDVNALYNALQDVKNGHSIYRAAQTYCVPRKTLRNWMKRLHIKSAYPMPRQLQAAAERKKIMQQQTTTFTSSGSLGELMVVSPNVGDNVTTSVSNASIP